MSSLVNKAKDLLGSNKAENPTFEQPTTEDSLASAGSHTETAQTGPVHNSETLNKVDPRVHEQGTTNTATSDRADASRHPPSVMQQHLGEPTVEHDYPHDSTHKRHSISHQEQHLMR